MTDLVVISLERWDEVWRRNQHLIWRMLEADPGLRVLFVEPAADPTHAIRSRRRPELGHRATDAISPGRLWTLRPLKLLPRRVDPRGDARMAARISRAAQRLGMVDPILWVNDPGGAEVARATGWRIIYDITDDWLAAQRPVAEITRVAAQEAYLLAVADQVVACSSELRRRKSIGRSADRDPVQLVPNAVDTAAYRRPHPRPADLPGGAAAVYVGTLHGDRLDVSLCASVAERLSGAATLVLVGPDALTTAESAALRAAGALLLGPRDRDAVIGYLQHADVLVVPHKVTSFTESLDPIKLYEYQAVGRPVVSTPVAGFRDADDDRILIADADGFAEAVSDSLAESRPFPAGSDRSVADWDTRASAMLGILARMGR